VCFNALLLARAAEQKQVHPAILKEVVADLDLDRIRLNTGTPPSGMRGVQTTTGQSLGNTAEDPPATSIDKTCKATVSGAKADADDASTRLSGFDGVDPLELETIAVEIVSTSSGENAEQAAVSGAKADADDASTRLSGFDGVDPLELGTIAAEIVSTGSGENAEQAAVSGDKAEADDAATRPTALDEVDLVQIGTVAAGIVSTNSGERAEQAVVSGAKAEADDASTQPTAFDEVDLVQLGTIAAEAGEQATLLLVEQTVQEQNGGFEFFGRYRESGSIGHQRNRLCSFSGAELISSLATFGGSVQEASGQRRAVQTSRAHQIVEGILDLGMDCVGQFVGEVATRGLIDEPSMVETRVP